MDRSAATCERHRERSHERARDFWLRPALGMFERPTFPSRGGSDAKRRLDDAHCHLKGHCQSYASFDDVPTYPASGSHGQDRRERSPVAAGPITAGCGRGALEVLDCGPGELILGALASLDRRTSFCDV